MFSDGNTRALLCSDSLRVLCYNIHDGQGTDGKYDIERLAKVIQEAKPDLVALQEVDVGVKRSGRVHKAQRLAELTRIGRPLRHYEGGLIGNAVLSRLEILDVQIHPLPYAASTPNKTTYPRGAIAVTVRGPSGHPLRFVSTHFQTMWLKIGLPRPGRSTSCSRRLMIQRRRSLREI